MRQKINTEQTHDERNLYCEQAAYAEARNAGLQTRFTAEGH
jgi:hypothetical protein